MSQRRKLPKDRPTIDRRTGLPTVPDLEQLRSVLAKLRTMGPEGDAELVELIGIFAAAWGAATAPACPQIGLMFSECEARLRRAYSLAR